MAEAKDMISHQQVSSIRYVFSIDDLFQGINLNRYKTEESAEKYRVLCEYKLSAEYPNATVEVSFSMSEGVLPVAMKTVVYAWQDLQEIEVPEEVKIVNQYCDQIYQRHNDWLVRQNIIHISEVPELSKLPLAVIRWICANGLLQGAEKPSGCWEVGLEALLDFDQQNESYDTDKFVVNLGSDNNILVHYFEKLKEIPFADLMQQDKVLVISREGFGIYPFNSNSSYFFLSKLDSRIQISLEHFVDVEPWSESKWLYPGYAKAIVEQAITKNVDGQCQTWDRNGHEVIDGISFRFIQSVEENITPSLLFRRILQEVSEVVNAAELWLAGGPIWDKVNDEIYRDDEDKFCKEVLSKLIPKMGFKNPVYTHGTGERGRDFVFEYQMPFDETIYIGLQAKKGDLKGTANPIISNILEQITRAFENAYIIKLGPYEKKVYISIMILAISGEFTDDALDIIRSKLPKYHFPIGSIYFWDKRKILSLISQYWGRSIE